MKKITFKFLPLILCYNINFSGYGKHSSWKNNYKFFFIFWDIFIYFFTLFICNFFQSCFLIFHSEKIHIVKNEIKKE